MPSNFFQTLFKAALEEDPGMRVFFTEKTSDGGMRGGEFISPNATDAIEVKIKQAVMDRADLYFHCGVGTDEAVENRKVRYKKSDVKGCGFLWVDVDRPGVSPDELAAWTSLDRGPSLIVRSGGGYHLYWVLDEFSTDIPRIEAANRFLAERLKGDNAVDVSRILRVPGSKNFKKEESRAVSVLFSSEKRFSLESFKLVHALGRDDAGEDSEEFMTPYVLPDDFLSDPRFGPVSWLGWAITEEPAKDRSDRDFKVAVRMAERGFSKTEVFAVLTHPTWVAGEKGRASKSYARRTVNEAFRKSCVDNSQNLVDSLKASLFGDGSAAEEGLHKVGKPVALKAQPKSPVETKVASNESIMAKILSIHSDVLEVGGRYRPEKESPKLGGVFGRLVAEVIRDSGYRFVYDPEYGKSFIADRKGAVWEASQGMKSFNNFVTSISGFSSNQTESKFIAAGIQNFIEQEGEQIQIGRWTHYDAERNVFCILRDNQKGIIFCINEHGETWEEFNGDSDVFLRPRTQASLPLDPDVSFAGSKGLQLFRDKFVNYIAGPEETKRFLECFTLALTMCYGADIRTLPMLHLTGPSGGGKSSTLGCMTNFLFGYYQVLIYTTAAAFRVAPDETFMAHDDKEEIKDGMEEFLLLCSTSALRTMCDKNNAEDVVIQKAHAVNALTSIEQMRTTALRRRTLVVEIDADKYPSKVNLTSEQTSDIVNFRDQMWGGMTPVFAGMIRHFKSGRFREVAKLVYNSIKIAEFKGLADFVALMVLVDGEISKELGRKFRLDTSISDFIRVAGLEDRGEILGRDPLVLCLESFFERLFSTNTKEVYQLDDFKSPVQSITINRTVNNCQWDFTTEEENTEVSELLGCKVRGIKASATGWVSIFSTDTREFARTINSPPSLGRQFSRVETDVEFPFFITRGTRHKDMGRTWNVFQKIE